VVHRFEAATSATSCRYLGVSPRWQSQSALWLFVVLLHIGPFFRPALRQMPGKCRFPATGVSEYATLFMARLSKCPPGPAKLTV